MHSCLDCTVTVGISDYETLLTQNAELLAALEACMQALVSARYLNQENRLAAISQALEAIAKAKGQ